MKLAFESGINFFDNAETYGTNVGDAERIMGDSLKELGWKRGDYVISTKIFWGGQGPNDRGVSRKHLLEGMEASLKRLQLDYVDIIFAHRPDLGTPMEEIVRGFTHLVNTGKALYWGTSEWSAQQITEAFWIARLYNLIPPTVGKLPCSLCLLFAPLRTDSLLLLSLLLLSLLLLPALSLSLACDFQSSPSTRCWSGPRWRRSTFLSSPPPTASAPPSGAP